MKSKLVELLVNEQRSGNVLPPTNLKENSHPAESLAQMKMVRPAAPMGRGALELNKDVQDERRLYFAQRAKRFRLDSW